jgi:hypothetical protein
MRSVTIVPNKLEIGSKKPEFACLESRLDDLKPDIASVTVLEDAFVVHDLLECYSFRVAQSESGYQLTFALEDGRQVIVAVEGGTDIALAAQKIAERLMGSGTRVQRLEFPNHSTQQDGYSALLAWRRRQHLIFVGYSEAEILRLGDLAKLTSERMNELMHSKLLPVV